MPSSMKKKCNNVSSNWQPSKEDIERALMDNDMDDDMDDELHSDSCLDDMNQGSISEVATSEVATRTPPDDSEDGDLAMEDMDQRSKVEIDNRDPDVAEEDEFVKDDGGKDVGGSEELNGIVETEVVSDNGEKNEMEMACSGEDTNLVGNELDKLGDDIQASACTEKEHEDLDKKLIESNDRDVEQVKIKRKRGRPAGKKKGEKATGKQKGKKKMEEKQPLKETGDKLKKKRRTAKKNPPPESNGLESSTSQVDKVTASKVNEVPASKKVIASTEDDEAIPYGKDASMELEEVNSKADEHKESVDESTVDPEAATDAKSTVKQNSKKRRANDTIKDTTPVKRANTMRNTTAKEEASTPEKATPLRKSRRLQVSADTILHSNRKITRATASAHISDTVVVKNTRLTGPKSKRKANTELDNTKVKKKTTSISSLFSSFVNKGKVTLPKIKKT